MGDEPEIARASLEVFVTQADRSAKEAAAAAGAAEESRTKAQTAATVLEQEAVSARGRIAELTGQIEAAGQKATAAQTGVEAAATAIEESRRRAQSEADEVARLKAAAVSEGAAVTQQNQNAATEAAAASASRVTADLVLKEIKEARERVEAELQAAQLSQKATTSLATIATETESRVAGYEGKLKTIIGSNEASLKSLTEQIKGLLPLATSAGLSAAFESRRKDLVRDRNLWTGLFIGSLVLLAGASYFLIGQLSLSAVGSGPGTSTEALVWTNLLLSFIRRFAILAPLVWFAIVASKQRSILVRIEEDYAHKVVMSNSFEGYKREVSLIGEEKAIGRLTVAVIEIIRRAPGRFYDKTISSDSPYEMFTEGAQKLVSETLTKGSDALAKGVEAVTKAPKA